MTATNHAVFGALTVAVISNPLIGLPLAVASHFLLDSLPHFGAHTVAEPSSKEFKAILSTDAFLVISFLILVAYAGHSVGLHWWLLPLGGFLGGIPDLMWAKHYRSDLRGEERTWTGLERWHKQIQRWELSWGWTIEAAWFIITVSLLSWVIFS